jgi:hypothetical protein
LEHWSGLLPFAPGVVASDTLALHRSLEESASGFGVSTGQECPGFLLGMRLFPILGAGGEVGVAVLAESFLHVEYQGLRQCA